MRDNQYAAMRDYVVKRLKAGRASHLGDRDIQTALQYLFESNGLLALFEARDKAVAANISAGSFVYALGLYQAIEMSTMVGTPDPDDMIQVTTAIADLYKLELLKNSVAFLGHKGELPPFDSPKGQRLAARIKAAHDQVEANAKGGEETDKPT